MDERRGAADKVGQMSEAVAASPLVVVSNRGPRAYSFDESGQVQAREGSGGLVTALAPLLAGSQATWVAAAMSEADRLVASKGPQDHDGVREVLVAVDPESYQMAYDVVSNGTLWFLHHHLYDLARRPRIDRTWLRAWDAYREVNNAFAEVVAQEAPEDAVVLVQDYHLSIFSGVLSRLRPDLRTVHFTHTPWCAPEMLVPMASVPVADMFEGMAANRACGFHAQRWASAYVAGSESRIGRSARTFVAPLAPDPDRLEAIRDSQAGQEAMRWVDEQVEDHLVIANIARMDPAKNLLRSVFVIDELLDVRPEWRGKVVYLLLTNPTREGLSEYQAYRDEVVTACNYVNERWGTSTWKPVILETGDDLARSVAAMTRYDVLLINPIRDGLNLVAKEGPVVNERSGAVVLSTEAGSAEELEDLVSRVNPFDISATAAAVDAGLRETPEERAAKANALFARVTVRSARYWLEAQIEAAGS